MNYCPPYRHDSGRHSNGRGRGVYQGGNGGRWRDDHYHAPGRWGDAPRWTQRHGNRNNGNRGYSQREDGNNQHRGPTTNGNNNHIPYANEPGRWDHFKKEMEEEAAEKANEKIHGNTEDKGNKDGQGKNEDGQVMKDIDGERDETKKEKERGGKDDGEEWIDPKKSTKKC